jgi:hypothetical protein
MAVYGIEQRPDASHFPWWNHWPVAQLPSDGRYCQAPDRPSHFSLAWGGPPFHDADGNIIKARESGSEGELEIPEDKKNMMNTYWLSWMYGASQQTPEELARIARSWAQPPEPKVSGNEFTSRGYDLTQRAYILENNGPENNRLEMELLASNESSVVNVCFVVKGWNTDDISIQLDGKMLENNKDYSVGIIRNLEKDDLILWIKIDSEKASGIIINKHLGK